MLAREERGRLNTALLQPMAIYEATLERYKKLLLGVLKPVLGHSRCICPRGDAVQMVSS